MDNKFIIEKNESVNKTIRLPVKLIKQMEDKAYDYGISFNQLVLQCCKFAMAHLSDDEINKS